MYCLSYINDITNTVVKGIKGLLYTLYIILLLLNFSIFNIISFLYSFKRNPTFLIILYSLITNILLARIRVLLV
jgi:phosphoglycerol transferase MdoB-like AlkP superfamily enzyme